MGSPVAALDTPVPVRVEPLVLADDALARSPAVSSTRWRRYTPPGFPPPPSPDALGPHRPGPSVAVSELLSESGEPGVDAHVTGQPLSRSASPAIDLICDHGDTAEARREQLRTATGTPMWKVTIRGANSDWVVLWWPVDDDAQIYCIGAP